MQTLLSYRPTLSLHSNEPNIFTSRCALYEVFFYFVANISYPNLEADIFTSWYALYIGYFLDFVANVFFPNFEVNIFTSPCGLNIGGIS